MLTPKQLQELPKPLTDSYSELSEFILRDIARRIAGAAQITDTAQYQMYRARALGLSTDEIAAEIARINGVGEKQIRRLIEQAAKTSDEFDRRMLGKEDSESVLASREQLQKLLRAQIEHTSGQCRNFTRSLGFAERNAYGQVVYSALDKYLYEQMDAAHLKVMNGVTDYNTAIRQACNALAESGVRTVYYNSGHSDRIEVAVRRALMTSVSQVTQKISEQNAEEFGADGWEISAHCGARPSHAIYQGRQYPNSRYETIVKPLIEDYNCRHSAYPIIMGLTEPSYTEGELAALDPPPFVYEGRTYTAYEAQQQMRKMERAMRKQKDLCIVADAMGDTDTYTAASIRLRRQKDIYEDFCGAGGVYTEYERTFVAGYNRSLAAKTGAVTRKQRAFDKAQVRLTEEKNRAIIEQEKRKEQFRSDLKSGKINTAIDTNSQQKHINSSVWRNQVKLAIKSWGDGKKTTPKSRLFSYIDPQALVDEYAGKGRLEYRPGSDSFDEFITLPFNVGVTFDKATGKYVKTNVVQIKYSSEKGVHVFPTKGRE